LLLQEFGLAAKQGDAENAAAVVKRAKKLPGASAETFCQMAACLEGACIVAIQQAISIFFLLWLNRSDFFNSLFLDFRIRCNAPLRAGSKGSYQSRIRKANCAA
jgi:hypothetical protein